MVWATANSNLALVKYWGKAPGGRNRAASASLSVTLDGLTTTAGVEERSDLAGDRVEWLPPGPTEAVTEYVGAVRRELGIERPVAVVLTSNFPVAAGLASSASAYAALASALAAAAPRRATPTEVAALARRGSGSACRSLFGGFVEWRPDGGDDAVTQVAPPDHWSLAILVAVTREGPKSVGSREGMKRTAATSPYYEAWLSASTGDLDGARAALAARDLGALGPIAERNALRMHAAAIAADPPLLYWEPATIAVMQEVARLRARGTGAFFSIDAGPQVKVLCESADADRVAAALAAVPGVSRVLRSRPGGGPEVLDRPPAWALGPLADHAGQAARRAVG